MCTKRVDHIAWFQGHTGKSRRPYGMTGRISDAEMAEFFPESNWEYQIGEAGSVFFVDTKAFHKGVPLIEGERHLAQIYYIDTLFGEHVPLAAGTPEFRPARFRVGIRDCSSRFLTRYALRNENVYQGQRQNLPETGFWPNPAIEQNGRSLFRELPFRTRSKFITKTTPLISADSWDGTAISNFSWCFGPAAPVKGTYPIGYLNFHPLVR
jgi:hypothetical protein